MSRFEGKAGDPLVTVFTPAYNRDKYLPRLYASLVSQTDSCFEWVVVDDGSTDGTTSLLEGWREEASFPVSFVSVPNGGKNRAVNLGLSLARGRLFLIVDSDDYLTPDAIARIRAEAEGLDADRPYAGLCFRRGRHPDGAALGGAFPKGADWKGPLSNLEYDKAEVFFTERLKARPFPEFPGERFMPEGYVWDEISSRYPVRLVDEVIYLCEYLPGGLSDGFRKSLKENPHGFRLYYRRVAFGRGYPLLRRLKALIRLAQIRLG